MPSSGQIFGDFFLYFRKSAPAPPTKTAHTPIKTYWPAVLVSLPSSVMAFDCVAIRAVDAGDPLLPAVTVTAALSLIGTANCGAGWPDSEWLPVFFSIHAISELFAQR